MNRIKNHGVSNHLPSKSLLQNTSELLQNTVLKRTICFYVPSLENFTIRLTVYVRLLTVFLNTLHNLRLKKLLFGLRDFGLKAERLLRPSLKVSLLLKVWGCSLIWRLISTCTLVSPLSVSGFQLGW